MTSPEMINKPETNSYFRLVINDKQETMRSAKVHTVQKNPRKFNPALKMSRIPIAVQKL